MKTENTFFKYKQVTILNRLVTMCIKVNKLTIAKTKPVTKATLKDVVDGKAVPLKCLLGVEYIPCVNLSFGYAIENIKDKNLIDELTDELNECIKTKDEKRITSLHHKLDKLSKAPSPHSIAKNRANMDDVNFAITINAKDKHLDTIHPDSELDVYFTTYASFMEDYMINTLGLK